MASNIVVVIPTSNRSDLLERTLTSLADCRFPNNYRETIVVENGSRKVAESTATRFQQELNLRYIYLPYGNKSHALNSVLGTIDDSLVVFFDDDVRVDPGILEAYAEASQGKDSGEFYGGPFQVDYVKPPPEWLKEFLPKSAIGWSLGQEPQRIEKGNLFGGLNWAAFTRDLKNLNGFSTDHGPGSKTNALGQETEMEGRLMDGGVVGRYVPLAMVWHYVPPERCSKQFASIRAYRWGIQGGLRYSGSVIPLIRGWLNSGIKTLLRIPSSDPGRSFAPYLEFRFKTGFIKGCIIRLISGE